MTLPITFRLPFCHIFLSTLHHSLTDLTSKTSPGRSSRPVVTQPKLMIFPNQQQHKCLIPMHVQHFCLGNILPLHSSYFRHPAVPINPATPCHSLLQSSSRQPFSSIILSYFSSSMFDETTSLHEHYCSLTSIALFSWIPLRRNPSVSQCYF